MYHLDKLSMKILRDKKYLATYCILHYREEEIIMPEEHSGHVKDNYLWKVMLHRSAAGPDGIFMSVADGEFDQDLFLLSWGPTVAALSYIYDHADDKTIAQKAIKGFR